MTKPDRYTPEERRNYTNQWRAERRRWAIRRLGGKCIRCGRTNNLHFDHIDPATKSASIAKMWTASKEKFEAEVLKCQLLCEAHHREKTRENREYRRTFSPLRHGSHAMYKHGCRCDDCWTFVRTYMKGWKKKQKARRESRAERPHAVNVTPLRAT